MVASLSTFPLFVCVIKYAGGVNAWTVASALAYLQGQWRRWRDGNGHGNRGSGAGKTEPLLEKHRKKYTVHTSRKFPNTSHTHTAELTSPKISTSQRNFRSCQ